MENERKETLRKVIRERLVMEGNVRIEFEAQKQEVELESSKPRKFARYLNSYFSEV